MPRSPACAMSPRGQAWTTYESPLGRLTMVAGPRGISNLYFAGRAPRLEEAARCPMHEVTAQLDAYFGGERQGFDLDLEPVGTPLQLEVWRRLLQIPYGSTVTYGRLARQIDDSLYPGQIEPWERARLAGWANGSNPLPILVPCHRVVGAGGALTGYLGGLQRKQALLDLERKGAEAAGGSIPGVNRQLDLL
jgi:methylated-DNA-[protein]-cysteine S-methyltransferase